MSANGSISGFRRGLSRAAAGACATALAVMSIPLSGCGDGRPELVEAVGTVTLNGEPLNEAIVSFVPVSVEGVEGFARPLTAVTGSDGRFRLGTYSKEDGAPPGKYNVGIQKLEVVGDTASETAEELPPDRPQTVKWITPKSASDPATSGLEAEVTENGIVPAVFELQRAGEPEIETTGRRPVND